MAVLLDSEIVNDFGYVHYSVNKQNNRQNQQNNVAARPRIDDAIYMDATNTDIHILHIDGAVVRSTTDRAEAEIMLGRALEIVSGRTDRAYLHTIRIPQGVRR